MVMFRSREALFAAATFYRKTRPGILNDTILSIRLILSKTIRLFLLSCLKSCLSCCPVKNKPVNPVILSKNIPWIPSR